MKLYYFVVIVFMLCTVCQADGSITNFSLPAIETFVTEPTVIENVNIWVPAAKSGPFINQSCRIKKNLEYSVVLPASIKHQKTDFCPEQTARILAELTSYYYSESLPLTIFNGWKWEYPYNMCQYESVSYNLEDHGGSWENGLEAILDLSCGVIQLQQLDINSFEKFKIRNASPSESIIEINTFNSMRTRNGYPKERQL